MTPTREQIDADRARQEALLTAMREMLCEVIPVSVSGDCEPQGDER